MITLISGALGTGKTALAVKLFTESEFYPESAFVFGVRGWKGKGQWYELAGDDPKGNQALIDRVGQLPHSVFLLDEAKKVWPTRIAGKPVPAFIDGNVAESRSVSQDWIVTCQAPRQVDVALRSLVGRHIHLEKTAFGIKKSEAGSCREDLKFEKFEVEKYDFPVSSLALYETDEGETKAQKKGLKLPKRFLWMGLLVIACFSIAGYFFYKSRQAGGMFSKIGETVKLQDKSGSALVPLSDAMTFREKLTPRDLDDPNSAPMFAAVRPRAVAVEVMGCVASASRCVCYSQQGTRLLLPDSQCRERVENRFYDPFKQPVSPPDDQKQRALDRPAGSLLPPNKTVPNVGGSQAVKGGQAESDRGPTPSGEMLTGTIYD